MKRIIDGKIYDTENAILLGEAKCGYYSEDHVHFSKQLLYQTRKSKTFFVTHFKHGLQLDSPMFIPIWRFEVVTQEVALKWCENNLKTEEIEILASKGYFKIEEA